MTHKTIQATLCGAPNVGKSTILNSMIGADIFISSPKPQSTRRSIDGHIVSNNTHVALTDTPGITDHKSPVNHMLQKSARTAAAEAETILFVVDAKHGFNDKAKFAWGRCANNDADVIIIINKIDLIDNNAMLGLIEAARDYNPIDIFAISARFNVGVDALVTYLERRATQKSVERLPNTIAAKDYAAVAADITREQLLRFLSHEVPYQLHVHTDSIESTTDICVIKQTIFVVKDSHAFIVIGRDGATLKKVAKIVSKRIETIFGYPVKMMISVKVWPKWMESMDQL